MLGTGLILYLLSKEIYVITPETFSAISTIGFLVYVVKKYGASVGEFADKLNEVRTINLPSILDSTRSIKGEGNGTLLQYSCLGNPMDRAAW